ncbi:uncharacterized protein LOC142214666 [Leptodactylus fuscus]|uniref:uncharacterized protein LOC142214666 n=1 Tax=Leptodactylus fuscus TaxID=238119 RepID=UPI003F4F158B
MAGLQVFIVLASIFTAVSGSHMQGGTVSFKATEKTQTGWLVDFTYKSSFIDGNGGPFYWGCLSGHCGVELNHWSQPVENKTSSPSRWYQYEGHMRRRVDSDKPFQLWERGCCWVANKYNIDGWQLTTSVDLGVRSDTQKPNSSPVTSIIPVIRVPQNCATTIHLLGHDPDGDHVRCRYGYYNGECESCYWDFNLDHNKCTVFVPSWISPGFYVEQFILEDFPKKNIYLKYNDGTKIYRYGSFSRKRRELPKGSQKYYWYGTTESVTTGGSLDDMTTYGIETSMPLLPDVTEQETTTEPLQDIKTSPYYYMTEAVTDISPETPWEPLPDIKTTLNYYITEDATDTFEETTMEPLEETTRESPPDIRTTPHYHITEATTDIFEESSGEPLPDIETTPYYYTKEVVTDTFEETTMEPLEETTREPRPDTKTTPQYYITEAITDTFEETTTELLPDFKTTPHYYMTEAVTDISPENTWEPLPDIKTTPHIITEAATDTFDETTREPLPEEKTTPHHYITEATTDFFEETTTELLEDTTRESLPDIRTTPHYYITEATTDIFEESSGEPLPDIETTPYYYTTEVVTDTFEETTREPLPDIKTTPQYYITEAITDIFEEATTELLPDFKTTPHYYMTEAVTDISPENTWEPLPDIKTTLHIITEAATDTFDETTREPLPEEKTTPHSYITEAITDFFEETTTELLEETTRESLPDIRTTPLYYITEATTDIFEEGSGEPLPDIETTPYYYTTEVVTDTFEETTMEPLEETTREPLPDIKTTPQYYITEAITDIFEETTRKPLPDTKTTPYYYTTEVVTDTFEETTMEPLEETTREPLPDIKTTPQYYITEAITDIFEETTREPLPDTKTTPYYYTTEVVTDIFEETTREPLPDTNTTPKYHITEATTEIFEETTREPLPGITTTPHYYITEAVTDPSRRTTSVFEETTQHILTTTTTAPYETTGWDISPTVLPNNMDPLSKISLQFIVEVTDRAPSCTFGDYRPKFIFPTPLQGEQLRTNVGRVFQLHLSAQAAYESVSDFKVSGPPGISKSFTHTSRSTTRSMVAEWRPSENNVGDHVPFCFVAETSNGYQSEMRCVVVVVGPGSLDTIQLTCHENTMTLVAAKSSDHELYENQFRLNDPKCLVSSNSTHLIASVAYNSCGTETEETDHDIVFKNQATSFRDNSSVITRKHGVSIPFNCSFPKKTRVSSSFRAHKSDYVFSEAGFANFTYKFQFYTDDLFEEVESEYPLEVTLRELLFMEIQVSSSVPNVQLFVESCKATPHDNPNDPTFYDIVQNGCIMDETFVVYSSTRTQYRFAMEAFAFMGDYSEVYMSCTMILCKLGEPGTRCTQGCITKSSGDSHRQRRSLSSESQQHYISQGPITMKRQSPSNTDLGGSPSLNVNTLVISLSGVAIVALLGLTVHTYMRRSRVSGYELLKTQDF